MQEDELFKAMIRSLTAQIQQIKGKRTRMVDKLVYKVEDKENESPSRTEMMIAQCRKRQIEGKLYLEDEISKQKAKRREWKEQNNEFKGMVQYKYRFEEEKLKEEKVYQKLNEVTEKLDEITEKLSEATENLEEARQKWEEETQDFSNEWTNLKEAQYYLCQTNQNLMDARKKFTEANKKMDEMRQIAIEAIKSRSSYEEIDCETNDFNQ